VGTACATTCASDAACIAGYFCDGSTCKRKLGNGSSCSGNSQCTSGNCASGLCCDKACAGSCQSCRASEKVSGPDGTCGDINARSDPRNGCAQESATTCGRDGQCNGAGACRLYAQGVSCGTTTCNGNQIEGRICDGLGVCVTAPSGAGCAPYQCRNAACTNPCVGSADCIAGNFCDAGTCRPLLQNGGACKADDNCSSGHCVNGLCCNAACNGVCQSCRGSEKVIGADGVCGNARAGIDPGDSCPNDGANSCARDGQCNGAGACGCMAKACPAERRPVRAIESKVASATARVPA